MLLWILVILLILSLGGGGLGFGRYGAAGMSPAGIILLLLVILYFTGGLNR